MIDRSVILAVIYVIGGNLIILMCGIVYASIMNEQLDAGISALAGSALGYLGGILTNVSRSRTPELPTDKPTPTPVIVENQAWQPVPTDAQPDA